MSEKFFNFITVVSHYLPKKKRSARTKPSRMFCDHSAIIIIFFLLYKYFFFFFFFCLVLRLSPYSIYSAKKKKKKNHDINMSFHTNCLQIERREWR